MTETGKRTTKAIILLLLAAITGLSGIVYHQNQKIESEIDNRVATTSEYESEITSLLKEKNQLERELEVNRALYEKVRDITSYMDVESLSQEEIEKAGLISDHTPLEFETSLIVMTYAKAYNLRPSLLLSVMETESNFDPYLVGTHKDRGLMQIIPATEKWLVKDFGSQVGMEYNPDNIFDAEYNIGLAVMYLSFLKDAYGNNDHRVLSEYNRGPYKLKEYYQRNGTYATSYSRKIIRGESKYVAYN